MTGEKIVARACAACEVLDCTKFEGHVAVEILKEALAEERIETSGRDVFIRDLPIEWDLVVPRDGAAPEFNGLLYEPTQVKFAIEVKLSGICGGVKALDGIRKNFVIARDAGVRCLYISFCDRRSQAATTEKLGWPAFNLTWSLGHNRREDAGDWPRLLNLLSGTARIPAPHTNT
jgi:hypothetical protein